MLWPRHMSLCPQSRHHLFLSSPMGSVSRRMASSRQFSMTRSCSLFCQCVCVLSNRLHIFLQRVFFIDDYIFFLPFLSIVFSPINNHYISSIKIHRGCVHETCLVLIEEKMARQEPDLLRRNRSRYPMFYEERIDGDNDHAIKGDDERIFLLCFHTAILVTI